MKSVYTDFQCGCLAFLANILFYFFAGLFYHLFDAGRMNTTVGNELVQREPNRTLVYCMAEESGPDHDKTFTFEVLLNGAVVGRGEGHSKKEAEQMAARAALERLE